MIIQSQRAQKRNQKVSTKLLFNFWDRININQVDQSMFQINTSSCVAETSVSLMFYQPARKVKRVQRKMWILIITKNQFHNRLLTCLFMISNNFWDRTERNCCQRGSNFTHSVLDARIQKKKLCTIGGYLVDTSQSLVQCMAKEHENWTSFLTRDLFTSTSYTSNRSAHVRNTLKYPCACTLFPINGLFIESVWISTLGC